MSQKDSFLYQINFNKKKYPEICEALEKAKDNNGIAFYLRKLISRDIEARKKGSSFVAIEPMPIFDSNPIENKKVIQKPKKEEIDLPDDNGGFM